MVKYVKVLLKQKQVPVIENKNNMNNNNTNNNKKKKILFISDDIRFFSGVSVATKEMVKQTVHKYDYTLLGGANGHPELGKICDMSQHFNEEANIKDAYCKLYPVNGYGDANILFQIIEIEKPDAIAAITDPRQYMWLFAIEAQIHTMGIPLVYWHIWDSQMMPQWNRPSYDSVDALLAISQQSNNVAKHVCDPLNCISLEGEFDQDGNLITTK